MSHGCSVTTDKDSGYLQHFLSLYFGEICFIIPLPVPNWASAEEQFIPNYPPQVTIYSKFFFENPNFSLSTKFFFLDLSWTYETIKHFHFLNTCFVCCCSPCSRVSLERLISNSRVAFDQVIVIIIIKYHQLSIEAKKINFPETCSKQYQFFSSAKYIID